MSLETEIRELRAAIRDLIAVAKANATGYSLNHPATASAAGNGAADEEESAESAPSAPAQCAAPEGQQTAKMSPENDEKHPLATAPRTAPEATTTAEDCKAELVADEYAGMDSVGFMSLLNSLVSGRSDHRMIFRDALAAIGEKSFRTLDKSKYGQAIGAVKAELTKAGA